MIIQQSGWQASFSTDVVQGRTTSNHDYVGLLGDAGAMVLLTNPELFVTRELPVRVNLDGIGRGQTIVDQRAVPQGTPGPDPDPWPRIAVVVDLDVAQAAADVRQSDRRPTTRGLCSA